MTELLACVGDAAEAATALAAGFDGVVVPGPGVPDGWPAQAVVGWIDGAALILARGAARQRLAVVTAPPDEAAKAEAHDGVLLRHDGRLLDAMPIVRLAGLIGAWREAGAVVALAGAIEPPDVPRLLALRPAMLLVGRALRERGERGDPLDPARLAAIRALVPHNDAVAPLPLRPVATRRDRIFVRDLVLALELGAYASEYGRHQRVRFSVEADLEPASPARGMADVVSYDLIADAIHRVAASERVEFVETLADALAAELLQVPRIVGVVVRVEKLDLGAGAVGLEIARGRSC